MKSPILGSSYVASSVNAADNVMVNLFPEVVPEGGKEPAFLRRCPGMTLIPSLVDTANQPIAGMLYVEDRSGSGASALVVVAGDTVFKLTPTVLTIGTSHVMPTGAVDSVSMADNGQQVFIAVVVHATGLHKSYVYDILADTLTLVVDPDFPGAETVVFMDGYFLVNPPNTQKIYCSDLYDGLSWNALAFASAERSPDLIVGLAVNNGELWVFGTNTTEVWYNAGTPNFPFAPMQGAYSEVGCVSAKTIAKLDNSLFWVGRDQRGIGVVYRSHGYSGERVSTHAIENLLQATINYPSGPGTLLTSAYAFAYQQDGHSFYFLSVPEPNPYFTYGHLDKSFVYDCATQAWHQRQSVDLNTGLLDYHWATCYSFVQTLGVIGSRFGGIYYFDNRSFEDAAMVGGVLTGYPQYWYRSWRALPPGQNNLNRTAHHSLQLDVETGASVSTVPELSLRWSDDGGHTWNTPRTASLGATGDYSKRVIWRRLGMTTKLRDRVYEVSGSDNGPINIMGAELHMSNTNA